MFWYPTKIGFKKKMSNMKLDNQNELNNSILQFLFVICTQKNTKSLDNFIQKDMLDKRNSEFFGG